MKLLISIFILFNVLYSEIIDFRTEPIQPISKPQNLDKQKVELGKKLFFEKKLSKDNSISCSSCHDLNLSGADNNAKSFGIENKKGKLNTPTVFNSSLNFVQFWDGRAKNLTEQIDGPIHNEVEMGTTWPVIIDKLNRDNRYKELFKKVYNGNITVPRIKESIVEFEKSLITPSRFDRYLLGDNTAISQEEKDGYVLFKDYGCASCHQGKNVGGNIYEKVGVYKPFSFPNNKNYFGRYNMTLDPKDKFKFKVPTLRNVYFTYPYFHNGMVETLDEAINIMTEYQLGIKIPEQDIIKIKAFLKSLTGENLEKNLDEIN